MLQGIHTYWETSKGKITLLELLEHTSTEEVVDAKTFEALLPNTYKQEDRIAAADLSYPIIVTVDHGVHKVIMDGQHRVVKALRSGASVKVRYLHIESLPTHIKDIFGFH